MNTQPFTYQIRVQGHLGDTLRDWFAPLQVTSEPSGEATLTGSLHDQAELYGMLLKLYKPQKQWAVTVTLLNRKQRY